MSSVLAFSPTPSLFGCVGILTGAESQFVIGGQPEGGAEGVSPNAGRWRVAPEGLTDRLDRKALRK